MILPWNSPTMPHRVILEGNREQEQIRREWCEQNIGQEGRTSEVYQYSPKWVYHDFGGMWYSTGKTWLFRKYEDAFNFVMHWK